MVVRLHIAPTMALASIDGVCGLVAVLVLFGVLVRTEVYREASVAVRWFGAAAFVLLMQWFLAWLLWLQKPETLPAAMCLALMLRLWEARADVEPTSQRRDVGHPVFHWIWKVVALVGLTALLSTFRADAACLLSFGVLLFVVLQREPLSLPRPAAMGTALLCALLAAAAQLWLMRVAFPQANYGRVKMWQLWPNVKHGTRWPPFLVFLLPLFWMAGQVVRRRFVRDANGVAFLFGAAFFMVLWVTIGKIDEVRIFLPFAFVLAPLTVEMAMLRVGSL
jgi:hypothetical protein